LGSIRGEQGRKIILKDLDHLTHEQLQLHSEYYIINNFVESYCTSINFVQVHSG